MGVFENYARYYDLLYRDKDYASEAQFVKSLINRYHPAAKSILELGCGTGIHAEKLAVHGFTIHGIDFSEEMLKKADARLSVLPKDLAVRMSFGHGDIRTLRMHRKYDVVISLFHVMSYQITNDDLESAFDTAQEHLSQGGIFIFDCWYGPAVLTDRPSTRVKRFEDKDIHVTRIAEPVMHPNENTVDVKYDVLITEKSSGVVNNLSETHTMRYLFKPEIEALVLKRGYSLVDSGEWLTNKIPGFDTWGCYFVVRA